MPEPGNTTGDAKDQLEAVENGIDDGEHPDVVSIDMAFADQHELDPSLDEGDYIDEPVKAVQVGLNRWRLEQNPIWTEMAAYKDVVEGAFDQHGVFLVQRVAEQSTLRTIRIGVPRMFYFSDFGKAFLNRVMELGGMWDLVFWGILILCLPEDHADELKHMFQTALSEAAELEKQEMRLPSRLYKERPEGGSVDSEEEN